MEARPGQISVLYLYEFTLLSNSCLDISEYFFVLYLYEFTLLSNDCCYTTQRAIVLYLYEFTLLSNDNVGLCQGARVLYLYEFTLLSNDLPLWSILIELYTSMNLHYSQTICGGLRIVLSFIPL